MTPRVSLSSRKTQARRGALDPREVGFALPGQASPDYRCSRSTIRQRSRLRNKAVEPEKGAAPGWGIISPPLRLG
jgi:hypothetical protein